MTLATASNKVIASGNGLTTAFAFAFPFAPLTSTSLQVIFTDAAGVQTVVAPANYTLAANPPAAGQIWGLGGTVTYPTAASGLPPIAVGTTLTISRQVAYVQSTSITNQSNVYPQVTEQGLDYEMMATEQLAELSSRSVQFPIIDQSPQPVLPAAVLRANKVLGFDGLGALSALTVVGATSGLGAIKSMKLDYGAVGNGVADDRVPFLNAVSDAQGTGSGVFAAVQGNFKTTGTITPNFVTEITLTGTDRPGVLGVFEGSNTSPSVAPEPSLWVQKHVSRDAGVATAHTAGGGFVGLQVHGSGNFAAPNRGTWHGMLVSSVNAGSWNGDTAAPLYDCVGDIIGLAGFAKSQVAMADSRIITGIWAYAEGPVIDATTYANLPAGNWAVCGIEINIKQNAPDSGFRTTLTGKGTSVGIRLSNFGIVGQPVRLWNFGTALAAAPSDGNFAGLDIELWNGHHVGHLVNQIWDVGILFGAYARDGSYGIKFPDTYAGFTTAARAVAIVQAAGVATVTLAAHGWATGQNIIHAGANEGGYNTPGGATITVVDVNTYTYVVNAGTASPATGAPTAAKFQRPKAAIYLGNNVLNWGQYTGSVFNVGDMWRNGNRIFWHDGATPGGREVVGSLGVSNVSGQFNRQIHVQVNTVDYYFNASLTPTSSELLNSLGVGSVTGQFNRQIHIQLGGVDYYFNASLSATGNEILNTTGVGSSVANAVTNKVAVLINGVQYYLLASTSAA